MANLRHQQDIVHETRNIGPLTAVTNNIEDSREHKLIDNRISNNPHIKRFIEEYSNLTLVRNIVYDIYYVQNYSMINQIHLVIAAYLYMRLPVIDPGTLVTDDMLYHHVIEYFYDSKHDLRRFIQINKENKEAYYTRFQLRLFRYLKLIYIHYSTNGTLNGS